MKVYISTNTTQPANCFEEDSNQDEVKSLVASLSIEVSIQVAPNVFLIQDSLPNISIEDSDNCILLYHTKTQENVKNAFKSAQKKSGAHEQGEQELYAPVFGVLIDNSINNEEKAAKIIEKLGLTKKEIDKKETLESKLNFLHHCLTPDGLSKEEVTKSEWAALNEFKSLTEVKPEKGKAEVDPFGDNYLSALRTLRDTLLAS